MPFLPSSPLSIFYTVLLSLFFFLSSALSLPSSFFSYPPSTLILPPLIFSPSLLHSIPPSLFFPLRPCPFFLTLLSLSSTQSFLCFSYLPSALSLPPFNFFRPSSSPHLHSSSIPLLPCPFFLPLLSLPSTQSFLSLFFFLSSALSLPSSFFSYPPSTLTFPALIFSPSLLHSLPPSLFFPLLSYPFFLPLLSLSSTQSFLCFLSYPPSALPLPPFNFFRPSSSPHLHSSSIPLLSYPFFLPLLSLSSTQSFLCFSYLPSALTFPPLIFSPSLLYSTPSSLFSVFYQPSGQGVRLESGRSRVRIPLAPGFFRGRVMPVT